MISPSTLMCHFEFYGYSNSASKSQPPPLLRFSEQALSPVPPNTCMGSVLYFRGTSRKMSASSASSSDRGKIAWRRLLATGRLPAALVGASSVVSSAAQWTSSILALVWATRSAACGQSTAGGGLDFYLVERLFPGPCW